MRITNRLCRPSVTLPAILLLALSFIANSTANAVRVRHRTPAPIERAQFDRWAFQGAIDEIVDDDQDYHGFQLSLSHFFDPDKALRINLGVFERGTDFTETQIFRSNDLVYLLDDFSGYDVNGATISLQGMIYSSPQPGPRLYLGLGPRFSACEANPSVWVTYYDDYNYEWAEPISYQDGSRIAFGIEGTLGFEWFLGRSLSMFAEYGATVQNEWYVFEFDRYNVYGHRVIDTEAFDDGIHVDDSHIKLGLSLYF